jgi:hypothetical protein
MKSGIMKTLLIVIVYAFICGAGIASADDANSERAQFDARVEQRLSDIYNSDIVAKHGNVVTLTRTVHMFAGWAALQPLRATCVALCVLEMDVDEAVLNPRHKPGPFIQVLMRESGGWIVGQAIVVRKDYADLFALANAGRAASNTLDRASLEQLAH